VLRSEPKGGEITKLETNPLAPQERRGGAKPGGEKGVRFESERHASKEERKVAKERVGVERQTPADME